MATEMEVAEETRNQIGDGIYDAMLNAMFPTNAVTGSYTQDDFHTWRIFGSPYMLLDDPPVGNVGYSGLLGDWYMNQLRQSQILTLKMGIPKYTGNKKGISGIDWFNGAAQAVNEGKDVTSTIIDSIGAMFATNTTGLNEAKRNYIFYNQYEVYLQYVRLLIISTASYLGVSDYYIPEINMTKDSNGYQYISKNSYTTISKMNWDTYTTAGFNPKSLKDIFGAGLDAITSKNSVANYVSNMGAASANDNGGLEESKTNNYTQTYYDVAGGPPAIIQFMVRPTYVTDNFTNDSGESSFQSRADKLREFGIEVGWLSGTTGDMSLLNSVANSLGTGVEGLSSAMERVTGDAATSILGASVVGMIRGLTGERMIFPKIYKDSRFSRNASYNIRLVSPQGDPYSYFINIALPLCYLIPMVAPKTTSVNAYRMPFMCQAYVTGQTAIPMGLVQSLSIQRGADGSMNKDGLPLEVDVSIVIEDLYSVMGVSSISDPAQFLSNESLIEYMASFTSIDTWNKSKVNEHIVNQIGDAVKDAALDIDNLGNRILFNLSEYAGNQLRMYGIADALR